MREIESDTISLPRSELVGLLRLAETSDSFPLSPDSLQRIHKVMQEHDEWRLRQWLEGAEQADRALPLLLEAQGRGTYLRTHNYRPGRDSTTWVSAPGDLPMGWPTEEILAIRGYPVQMVVTFHDRGSFTNVGSRLRPSGDERQAVGEGEVFQASGRCGNCGCTRDDIKAGKACIFRCVHVFRSNRQTATSAA